MSDPSHSPAAGWFADPARRFTFRYWSGDAWTDRVLTSRAADEERDPLDPELAGSRPVVLLPDLPATSASSEAAPRRVGATARAPIRVRWGLIGIVGVLVIAALVGYFLADTLNRNTDMNQSALETIDAVTTTGDPALRPLSQKVAVPAAGVTLYVPRSWVALSSDAATRSAQVRRLTRTAPALASALTALAGGRRFATRYWWACSFPTTGSPTSSAAAP